MKFNAICTIIVLLISSCHSPAPVKDYIGILRDTSGSRVVPVEIDSVFLSEIGFTLNTCNSEKWIEIYDVTSEAARPEAIHLQHLPESLPGFDANYRQRKEEIMRRRDSNERSYQSFVERATAPGPLNEDTRHSYLNKNLKVAITHLTDSTYRHRILLIDSDLLDDPRGQPEEYISDEVIQLLNEASARGALIYLYTETDREVLRTLNLRAKVLSHPLYFQQELKDIFNHPTHMTYEQR